VQCASHLLTSFSGASATTPARRGPASTANRNPSPDSADDEDEDDEDEDDEDDDDDDDEDDDDDDDDDDEDAAASAAAFLVRSAAARMARRSSSMGSVNKGHSPQLCGHVEKKKKEARDKVTRQLMLDSRARVRGGEGKKEPAFILRTHRVVAVRGLAEVRVVGQWAGGRDEGPAEVAHVALALRARHLVAAFGLKELDAALGIEAFAQPGARHGLKEGVFSKKNVAGATCQAQSFRGFQTNPFFSQRRALCVQSPRARASRLSVRASWYAHLLHGKARLGPRVALHVLAAGDGRVRRLAAVPARGSAAATHVGVRRADEGRLARVQLLLLRAARPRPARAKGASQAHAKGTR